MTSANSIVNVLLEADDDLSDDEFQSYFDNLLIRKLDIPNHKHYGTNLPAFFRAIIDLPFEVKKTTGTVETNTSIQKYQEHGGALLTVNVPFRPYSNDSATEQNILAVWVPPKYLNNPKIPAKPAFPNRP